MIDIFQVMKGENLQPRILYPVRLSYRFDREIKSFRQAKAKRIQQHQISFTTNAKGISLRGKETSNLKQPCTYIDSYIKTSWEQQTKKLQQIHTYKRKSKSNTTLKTVIKSQVKTTKEEEKKKDL